MLLEMIVLKISRYKYYIKYIIRYLSYIMNT